MRFQLLAALLFGAMVPALSADQPLKPDPYKEPATGLLFPSKLSDWNKVDDHVFEGPLGISVTYKRTDGTTASIYVYNAGLKSIPHDMKSPTLTGQFAQAKGDITTSAEERGTAAKKTTEDLVTTRQGDDSSKFFRAIYELTDKSGRELISHVYLSDYKNQFIKMRITFKKKDKEEEENAVAELLTEIGKMLKK